jgi:hypothetical protein
LYKTVFLIKKLIFGGISIITNARFVVLVKVTPRRGNFDQAKFFQKYLQSLIIIKFYQYQWIPRPRIPPAAKFKSDIPCRYKDI